jgi:hypothetical protein
MIETHLTFSSNKELLKYIKDNTGVKNQKWLMLRAKLGGNLIDIKMYNSYLQIFRVNGYPKNCGHFANVTSARNNIKEVLENLI